MRFLILGATGTLGRAMTKELLSRQSTTEIICLSRDELKLSQHAADFPDPRVKTVIGDIRDKVSILPHFEGIDVVFHFAALKRIPEMERFPLESVKTNLLGTVNAAECALLFRVPHFIFSSTDKACQPVNTYGASKFLSEQVLFNYNSMNKTNFSVYRWGNISFARGSALHTFRDKILAGEPVPITHENMSRYWMRIEEAIQFVLQTYMTKSSEPKIPKMKAALVTDLVRSVGRVVGVEPRFKTIGMRPGEKLHEDIKYIPQWNSTLNSADADPFTNDELDNLIRESLK